MQDAELNAIFPEESTRGQFSTNPYTYGDWIDPLVGHTPKRFTVFRVTVTNDIYAKVLLDPIKAVLYTDQGEVLHAYGLPSVSPHNSFERYYRAIRGQSGNEFYRFDLRMGNVRSTAYLEDVRVFKGESYSGLLAFDPLNEEVLTGSTDLEGLRGQVRRLRSAPGDRGHLHGVRPGDREERGAADRGAAGTTGRWPGAVDGSRRSSSARPSARAQPRRSPGRRL